MKITGNAELHEFRSPQDMLARPVSDCNAKLWDALCRRENPPYWFGRGAVYMKDALALAKKPWKEGVQKATSNLDNMVAPRSQKKRRKMRRGAFGDEVDMQSIWTGNVDRAWSTMKKERIASGRKNVRLIVQISDNALVSANELFWRGAAAIALTNAFRSSGYNVRVDAASACIGAYTAERSKVVVEIVTVKPYHMPLDMDRLASMLCFAGFFRSYIFRAILCNNKKVCESMGRNEDIREYLEGDDFTVIPNVNDQRKANEVVKNVLSHQQAT